MYNVRLEVVSTDRLILYLSSVGCFLLCARYVLPRIAYRTKSRKYVKANVFVLMKLDHVIF